MKNQSKYDELYSVTSEQWTWQTLFEVQSSLTTIVFINYNFLTY